MRFAIFSSIACLIAVVVAQSGSKANPPTVPSGYTVTAGKSSTFTWKPTTQGPVTLTLRSGASSDLNKGTVIASGIQNSGSYTFTLPADTTRNSDYTIEISADGDPNSVNYSAPFVVESSNTVESITPSGSTSATSAVASSASSGSSATSMGSSSGSAMSASSTASAKSATSSTASTSGSSAAMSSSSMPTSSSASSSSASSTASQAAAAPSTGAATKVAWNVQSGVIVMVLGALAVC